MGSYAFGQKVKDARKRKQALRSRNSNLPVFFLPFGGSMKRTTPEFKVVVPFEIKERQVKYVKDLQLPDWVKQLGMDEDLEVFEFKGYASTFGNVDHGDDVVERGAFLDSIQGIKQSGSPLPILWQHNMDEPVGIFVDLFEDDKGLFVHGIMPKSDEFVEKRVMPQMQIGAVRKMSIGFSIIKSEWKRDGDIDIRRLIKLHLWETSLVTIPMNSQADITEVKTVVPFQDLPLTDRQRPWDLGQAISRVRDFTGSEENPSRDYRRAFLWFDGQDANSFGAYKLPIADIVDGRLTAIPRGIFAAAAAMAGARGGVDIPEGDRPGVVANINRYYQKMGLESPLKSKGTAMERKGVRLASFLDRIIDQTAGDGERSDVIARMATEAGISESTVGQILSGDIICPPLERLRGFARALDTTLEAIVAAGEEDGCMYDEKGLVFCPLDVKSFKNLTPREMESLFANELGASSGLAKSMVSALKGADLREASESHRDGDLEGRLSAAVKKLNKK